MIRTSEIIIDEYIKDPKSKKLTIPQKVFSLKDQLKVSTLNPGTQNGYEKDKNSYIYREIKCINNQKNITEITVNNHNIIKICKNFFFNLSNLTSINLSNNSLGKISKNFKELTNLKQLILNNNCISVIPIFLKDLKLEEIQLEGNKIKLIPIVIRNFNELKFLNLSQNKLEKLPIELGLVNNLEKLYIDRNQFSEIPTSLCYLNNLKSIKIEWFEFLEPPLVIEQKDKNIITSFKYILEEKLLSSKMFLDFQGFIIKFSQNIQDKMMDESINTFKTEKTECYNLSATDIFYALNNNYLGVIKSFVKDNNNIINAKNHNGKTPLYLSIQDSKKPIYKYLLSKIDLKEIPNNYLFLFKAIRMRNFPLVVKLHKAGINLTDTDEKGNNVFHILFSIFYKNYDQCCQIGNYFIDNGLTNYNEKNKDGWGPVHIASKYSSYVCLEWINYINQLLVKQKKKTIDFNLLGKNKWTALHLAVSSYKYSECVKLLELNCNLFNRNCDGRMARHVTNNFFLTKMLYIKEYDYYMNKFFGNDKKIIKNTTDDNNKFTTNNCYSYKECTQKANSFSSDKEINNNSLISKDKKKHSFIEKYKFLMSLALNDNKDEVEKKCKEILSLIDFNIKSNYIIICDIISIVTRYNLTKFILDFKKYKKNLEESKNNSNSNFLLMQLNDAIQYLTDAKSGKINIITKINIYINMNNNNSNPTSISENSFHLAKNNNEINLTRSSKRPSNKNKTQKIDIEYKHSGRNFGIIIDEDFNNSDVKLGEKHVKNTVRNKDIITSSSKSKKLKHLPEKNIQESGNSLVFDFEDTIKNA